MKNFKAAKRRLRKKISYYKRLLAYYALRVFPVRSNKVVFSSYVGKGYGGNGKYIAEALLAQPCKYDLVWLVNDMNTPMPEGIRKVRNDSRDAIYELCTAKVWVDNCRKMRNVRKRKSQFYIQTWHGDVGMKKCEADALNSLSVEYVADAKNDSRMADLFVCGNQWMADMYRRSYWYSGEIAQCGYPRRDLFYHQDEALKRSIRSRLGLEADEKLVLYAPTFRMEGKTKEDLRLYNLDWQALLQALEDRFGGKWRGMLRLHPKISQLSSQMNIPAQAIDASEYPDMQELMLISDCVISDYSSSLFEFALMQRPGFIYAVDIAEYKRTRDLYFSFDEIPFEVSDSMEALLRSIRGFDQEAYLRGLKAFYVDFLNMTETGDASRILAERIGHICKTLP